MKIPSSGCWKSELNDIFRHNEAVDPRYAFEYWYPHECRWVPTSTPGRGPWTPCEDPSVDKEPRPMGPGVRRWLIDNPMKIIKDRQGGMARWNPNTLVYEMKDDPGERWFEGRLATWRDVVPVRKEGW